MLLTSVAGTFHAKVVAARLSAEGIGVEFRGYSEGPYPLAGVVDLFVAEEDAPSAREILLADEVDAIFLPDDRPDETSRPRWFRRRRAAN